jgi:1,4-dihydroxy-2-naphthoate octaprenyltransferase
MPPSSIFPEFRILNNTPPKKFKMFSRSTWLHLRIPFSYFLMPVYLFALGVSSHPNPSRMFWSFIIVHFFLYPASNGYNSYFDKDEKSIGGLKNPPPVNKGLYNTALGFDAIAIILGFIKINALFAVMILMFGLVSKAYSHPGIRLKKYAIGGWLVAGLFQGFFTFVMCYAGINNVAIGNTLQSNVLLPAALTSVMLWGNYPMTQVYQHEEDTLHGDHTMSRMLGIRGTFVFVQVVFALAAIGFVLYFRSFYSMDYGYAFLVALSPVVLFFMYWFYQVYRDESKADFSNTMRLNFISATCLNAFFIYFFLTSR